MSNEHEQEKQPKPITVNSGSYTNFNVSTDGMVRTVSGTIIGDKPSWMKITEPYKAAEAIQKPDNEWERTMRVSRPTIDKDEADALMLALGRNIKATILEDHIASNGDCWKGELAPLGNFTVHTLASCLYVGYRVRKPHAIRELYQKYAPKGVTTYWGTSITGASAYNDGYAQGVRTGIMETLQHYGITLEGVTE